MADRQDMGQNKGSAGAVSYTHLDVYKRQAHDSNMLNTTYKTMGVAVFVALKNDKQGYKRYYVLTFGK